MPSTGQQIQAPWLLLRTSKWKNPITLYTTWESNKGKTVAIATTFFCVIFVIDKVRYRQRYGQILSMSTLSTSVMSVICPYRFDHTRTQFPKSHKKFVLCKCQLSVKRMRHLKIESRIGRCSKKIRSQTHNIVPASIGPSFIVCLLSFTASQ